MAAFKRASAVRSTTCSECGECGAELDDAEDIGCSDTGHVCEACLDEEGDNDEEG